MKKIVTVGGGSGQHVLLRALRKIKGIEISALVSMSDSGGSSGRLRDEYGILPPGDALSCLLALAEDQQFAQNIFKKRFKRNSKIRGHNCGNFLLTILNEYTGNFFQAVEAFGEILNVQGRIFPITLDQSTLVARLENGKLLFGEKDIDIPRKANRELIEDIFLVPHYHKKVTIFKEAARKIITADYIIIGPGDLYTSIIPNLLVSGFKKRVKRSSAKIIYIVNLVTKDGETNGYTAGNFIDKIEQALERTIDIILINNAKISPNTLKKYQKENSYPVKMANLKNRKNKIIKKSLLSTTGGIIRHDNDKLHKEISQIVS